MKKVFLLISLLSLFVLGCNDSQNNDVEQLALIASNKISSLEQSNNQLKEELEKEVSVTGYLWKSGVPVGTYGDWTLTNDYAKYNKEIDNTYLIDTTNGNNRLKLYSFGYISLLPIQQNHGFVVYRADIRIGDDYDSSYQLTCDFAFGFEKDENYYIKIPATIERFEIIPFDIQYSDINKIDSATLYNIMNTHFYLGN